MAQQESSEDLKSKFSSLNVNAMEFVPSFGMDDDDDQDESPVSAQASAIVPEVVAAAALVPAAVPTDDDSVPASTISSSNNNGTSAEATTTTPISSEWSCNTHPVVVSICLSCELLWRRAFFHLLLYDRNKSISAACFDNPIFGLLRFTLLRDNI